MDFAPRDRLVLHGRMSEARELLLSHSCATRPPYAAVAQLLDNMPLPATTAFSNEALLAWTPWQQRCRITAQTMVQPTEPLRMLCDILTGDMVAIQRSASTWYEMLVAKLLYTAPTVKAYELQSHARVRRAGCRVPHMRRR